MRAAAPRGAPRELSRAYAFFSMATHTASNASAPAPAPGHTYADAPESARQTSKNPRRSPCPNAVSTFDIEPRRISAMAERSHAERVLNRYGIVPATLADTALRPARGSPSHFRKSVYDGMDTCRNDNVHVKPQRAPAVRERRGVTNATRTHAHSRGLSFADTISVRNPPDR